MCLEFWVVIIDDHSLNRTSEGLFRTGKKIRAARIHFNCKAGAHNEMNKSCCCCSCLIIFNFFFSNKRTKKKIEIKTIVKARARVHMPSPFITLITFGWVLCCWLLKEWSYFCLWLMSGTTFRHCSNNEPSRWIFWLLCHANSSVSEVLSRVRCLLLEQMAAQLALHEIRLRIAYLCSHPVIMLSIESNSWSEQKQKWKE